MFHLPRALSRGFYFGKKVMFSGVLSSERKIKMKTQSKQVRMLVEGALVVAMSIVLSYIDIPVGAFGGSVDFVMVPLIIYAVRWGAGYGLISGLVFGTLKFIMAGGSAVNWQSMLLDYSLAYMMVGLAGVIKNKPSMVWLSALVGCFGRFIIHFISGITIYAEYMPETYMGMAMNNVWFYSALYNGAYMLPNTVVAIICCGLLGKALKKYVEGTDLK